MQRQSVSILLAHFLVLYERNRSGGGYRLGYGIITDIRSLAMTELMRRNACMCVGSAELES